MSEENLATVDQVGANHGNNKQTRVVRMLAACNDGKVTAGISNAALLFMRILYWHAEVRLGHARLVIDGDDPNNLAERWVANTKELWAKEIGATLKQVRLALSLLDKFHVIKRRTGKDKNGSILHVQPTRAASELVGARLPKGVYWP